MKKLVGIQFEVAANITVDEDMAKAVGHGVKKGSSHVDELYKDIKSVLVVALKKLIEKEGDKANPPRGETCQKTN